MAYRYFTRKNDASKFAAALTEINGGYLPTWFKDGKSWRIQDDTIGNERMSEVLMDLGLNDA